MVLLPSGKLEPGAGDPANIALERDGDTRAWIICADEMYLLNPVKEVEVEGSFLLDALEYRNARVAYELAALVFKVRLQNLMITPHYDLFTILDTDPVIL